MGSVGEPAASCPRCHKPGIVHEDQRSTTNWKNSGNNLRFRCNCGHEWNTNKADAEAHGRFMDRSGLR